MRLMMSIKKKLRNTLAGGLVGLVAIVSNPDKAESEPFIFNIDNEVLLTSPLTGVSTTESALYANSSEGGEIDQGKDLTFESTYGNAGDVNDAGNWKTDGKDYSMELKNGGIEVYNRANGFDNISFGVSFSYKGIGDAVTSGSKAFAPLIMDLGSDNYRLDLMDISNGSINQTALTFTNSNGITGLGNRQTSDPENTAFFFTTGNKKVLEGSIKEGIVTEYETFSSMGEFSDVVLDNNDLFISTIFGPRGIVGVSNNFQIPKITSVSASDSNPTSNTTPNTLTNNDIQLNVSADNTTTITVEYSDGATTYTTTENILPINGLEDGTIGIKIIPKRFDRSGEPNLVQIIKDTKVDSAEVSSPEYANGEFTINKSANDSSGIQSETLKVNGTEIVGNTFIPSTEGIQNVELKVLDNVGNERTETDQTLYDATNPNASINPLPEFTNSAVDVQSNASDALSGLESATLEAGKSSLQTISDGPYSFPEGEGVYTFRKTATDRAGNTITVEDQVTFDTTNPNASMNGLDALTSQAINISTSQSDALSGIASQVLRGGKGSLNVISEGQFNFTEGDGSYNFEYEVTDRAGNSRIVTGQSIFDSTNPLAQILGLQQYTNSSLNVTSDSSDVNGIRSSVLEMNGTEIPEGNINFPEDGVYDFQLKVSDNAGNATIAAGQTIYDTTRPFVSVSSPAYVNGPFAIVTSASDANGIASEGLLVNGSEIPSNTFTPTVQGPQTIEYVATDNAGNQNAALGQTVFDNMAPAIELDVQLDGYSATMYATISDNYALDTYATEISRNGSAFEDLGLVNGEESEKLLPNGSYRLRVTAYDQAGNMGQMEETFDISEPPASAEQWNLYR